MIQGLKQDISKNIVYREVLSGIDQRGIMEFDPEAVGHEMALLSMIFGDTQYFDARKHKHKFMTPFVGKAYEWVIENCPQDSKILDICGGAGNLGLALWQKGYKDYILADMNVWRMRWGELLWKTFGAELRWQKENVLNISLEDESCSIVCLLGWEAVDLAYDITLKECSRILHKGGHLIFTYHKLDEIQEGNWDSEPGHVPVYSSYSINRENLLDICDSLRLSVVWESHGGHAEVYKDFFLDNQPRRFPQYLVVCRKMV